MKKVIQLAVVAALVTVSISVSAWWNENSAGNGYGYPYNATAISEQHKQAMVVHRAQAMEARRRAAEDLAVYQAAAYRRRMEAERTFADQLAGTFPTPEMTSARFPVSPAYAAFARAMEARRMQQQQAMEDRRVAFMDDSKEI